MTTEWHSVNTAPRDRPVLIWNGDVDWPYTIVKFDRIAADGSVDFRDERFVRHHFDWWTELPLNGPTRAQRISV